MIEQTNSIIVTVWFKNYKSKKSQNLLNTDVRETIWKIICKHHPNVIYTEADLSPTNKWLSTYDELAQDMEIDEDKLYNGPIVAVLYHQKGVTINADDNPQKLVKAVDNQIHKLEHQIYGDSDDSCSTENDEIFESHFEYYTPFHKDIKGEPRLKQPLYSSKSVGIKLAKLILD